MIISSTVSVGFSSAPSELSCPPLIEWIFTQMLSPAAVSNVLPSPVAFHLSAIFHNQGQVVENSESVTSPVLDAGLGTARPRVKDLTHKVHEMGLRLFGEVWGIKMGTGEMHKMNCHTWCS